MNNNLLWLDDIRSPPNGFVWAKNYDEAIEILKTNEIIFVSLDHDLASEHYWNDNTSEFKEKTGYNVIEWMLENNIKPFYGCTIHSMNPVGSERMNEKLNYMYGKTNRNFRVLYNTKYVKGLEDIKIWIKSK